ncbi:MAG: hypothetical protein ACYT04_83485, partial [Nostoc sp.]
KVSSLNAPIYFFAICSNKSFTTKPDIDSVYIDSQDDLLKLMEIGLHQTQAELERSQSQQQDTQAELERSQSQHQQTQLELERSQSQQQDTQAELERSQSQHQQTQLELERSQSQLQ